MTLKIENKMKCDYCGNTDLKYLFNNVIGGKIYQCTKCDARVIELIPPMKVRGK